MNSNNPPSPIIFVYRLLATSWLLTSPLALAAVDCDSAYQDRLKSDLKLSYQAFDQTMKGGFRALDELGCTKAAGDLIEAYIQANNANQSSLRWHIAQLRAKEGRAEEAVKYAKTVLSKSEDFSKDPLRWNDYVLATIAFLERDKEKLVLHRNKVAEGKEAYFGNALNLKLLDALIKHFDKNYEYASRHIES